MNRTILISILAGILLITACELNHTVSKIENQTPNQTSVSSNKAQFTEASYKPKNGYVPDEQTAISIAVAVWMPIYGKQQIESEKPYKATLKDGVWTVTGTLPKGYEGGTAIAEISQDSGCILRIIHEQ